MDPTRAKEILRALADGRDPATGEQFPPNNPYQQADTVRALYMALETLEKGGRARAPRVIDPNKPNAGRGWSPEEEQQLRDAFAAHQPIHEIAAARGRTTGAINSRLMRLGLITETATHRTGPGHVSNAAPVRRNPSGTEANSTAHTSPPPTMPPELTQEEKDSLPF